MKAIPLRMSEEFHKELKIKGAKDRTTMQKYIIELIKKDLERNKGE